MSTKHTPGPWYYVTGAAWTTPSGPDDGGACVAMRASNAPISPCQRDANLRLIAAAPELLDALEELAHLEEWEERRERVVARALAVIAKARGEP